MFSQVSQIIMLSYLISVSNPNYRKNNKGKFISLTKLSHLCLKLKLRLLLTVSFHLIHKINLYSNWDTIRNSLYEIVEKHVPSKLSKGKRNLPWISADIKRKMRKRDKLFSQTRKTDKPSYWKAYRQYRNYVTKIVRNSHQSYINNVIGNSLAQNLFGHISK